MSNFLNNTSDLEKIYNEVDGIGDLITQIKEALQSKSKAPTLINFTIGGTEFQAEDGMTWGEWIESEYNTDGWTVYSDEGQYTDIIFKDEGGAYGMIMVIYSDYSNAIATDEIIPDYMYDISDLGQPPLL